MIITDRLLIRQPEMSDAKPFFEALNRSFLELKRWMPWQGRPSLESTIKFMEHATSNWNSQNQQDFPMILVLKNSKTIIGASGFNERSKPEIPMYEIGYWLDTQYTGHGYMTEAVMAIKDFAFDRLKAARVQLCTQPENIKSIAIAKRCGFTQEAILKKCRLDCLSGKPCDEVVYACFAK